MLAIGKWVIRGPHRAPSPKAGSGPSAGLFSGFQRTREAAIRSTGVASKSITIRPRSASAMPANGGLPLIVKPRHPPLAVAAANGVGLAVENSVPGNRQSKTVAGPGSLRSGGRIPRSARTMHDCFACRFRGQPTGLSPRTLGAGLPLRNKTSGPAREPPLMVSAPCSHLGYEARKRERVRCSSLVDWPVYPRLRRTMQTSTGARNTGPLVAARPSLVTSSN